MPRENELQMHGMSWTSANCFNTPADRQKGVLETRHTYAGSCWGRNSSCSSQKEPRCHDHTVIEAFLARTEWMPAAGQLFPVLQQSLLPRTRAACRLPLPAHMPQQAKTVIQDDGSGQVSYQFTANCVQSEKQCRAGAH